MDTRRYLAELIGTFILVFVGSMSILAAVAMDVSVLLVVPFGFGLGLLAAIQGVAWVSGGHFNPAVTLAAFLDKRIDAKNAGGYVVAQIVGAIAASLLVLIVSGQASVAGTANDYLDDSLVQALLIETALTAIFVLVILNVTTRATAQAPFTIPLTLTVIHFAGIPFSGASVNPARSFGPALVGGVLDAGFIVYLVGPLLGAVIGWAIYRVLDDGEPAAAA
jgi:aquaporin Z